MFAVFKRELKSYFQTVIGWLFIAAILALYGLYFYAYNLRSGYPYISYALSAISFIMLIAVPLLTMRSLAEERHSRTDQLILTSPVSLGKIICGKYLAMAAVFSVDMVIIGLTPLILSIYGTVPLGESYVAILGFWLYGCACIAIGMFISSITESQVIAAVLTFAALFSGYMMDGLTGMISSTGNILTNILNCYDLYTPMDSFMNGCLDVTGIVYFLSIIVLFLFLTCQIIQKRRWSINSKKLSFGVFSSGLVAAAIAAVVVVNLVVRELPAGITAIDATSTQIYSITDDTKEYLKGLDEDITIYVLASEKNVDTTLAETLERYEGLSNHITVSYVNMAVNPTFYQQYTDTTPTSNSLIVVSDERSRVIDYNDIYVYSYDYTSYTSTIDGYDAEGQITSAIEYTTMDSSELPVIYEVTGHGETALSGGFTQAIEKANITLSELTLLTEETVPEDAAAIIINGPSSDFSEDDASKVIDYLNAGGKVILSTNYMYQGLTNFESILSEYKMARVAGIVMENSNSYYYSGTPYYLLPTIDSTDYSSSVTGSYVFAPYSEGISYPEDTDTISYIPILETTDAAVSKVDAANATTSELEEGDIAGPFAIAAAMEMTTEDSTAQLVVFGSMEMLTDNADQIVSGNNSSLFTDTISTLIGDSSLASSVIASKDYTLSAITVTTASCILLGLGLTIAVPVVLILLGIAIWVMRRKK